MSRMTIPATATEIPVSDDLNALARCMAADLRAKQWHPGTEADDRNFLYFFPDPDGEADGYVEQSKRFFYAAYIGHPGKWFLTLAAAQDYIEGVAS